MDDEWSSTGSHGWNSNQCELTTTPLSVCASCFTYYLEYVDLLEQSLELIESLQEQLRKREVVIGALSIGIVREQRTNQGLLAKMQSKKNEEASNSLLKRIDSLERQIKNEKEQVQYLKTEIGDLQTKILSSKPGQHKGDLNAQREAKLLQERISNLIVENNKLKGQIEKKSKENDNIVKRKTEADMKLKIKNADLQRVEYDNFKLKESVSKMHLEKETAQKRILEIEQANIDSKEILKENESLQGDIIQLQNQLCIFQEEIIRLTTERKPAITLQQKRAQAENKGLKEKIHQLTTVNNMLREEISEISKEKDNALTRLSKIAGAKLTHGNAAITDLSDTNRPTKLAEKFSELYDNQWTDAFEELDNTYKNEEATIQALMKILKDAYDFCAHTEQTYKAKIEDAVFTLQDESTKETSKITCADVPVRKALADLRLSLGNACCSALEKMFLARLPSILKDVDFSVSPKTKLYARQCASLCWRMRIRDPPVFVRFEFRRGTEFNTDILRRYTKTGGYLDFIVWPALYLHENGPVLSKGVAQPKHSL